MKHIFSIAALLLSCALMYGQDDPAAFKSRYERQVRTVGAAGVGVETILDRWEAAFPDDPAMLEGRYNYFLAKARSTEVVPKDASRYLGAEPVLTLKDSTGRDVYYYQEDFYVDSLFARSQTAIDKAIALQPSELGYRVDKITALMLYEKGSPDLATAELLKLIQYNKTARPSWTYYGLAVDDDTFVATVQEYCFNFFRFATPGCYEAFRTVSEEMLKIYPKNTDFLSNVGSYWLVYKQKPRQALKWYNKVLKINPKDYTAAKNCVILARSEKNPKLEKKYLPLLMEASDSEAERASCRARLETLGK
jgi:tetratricopeptide (TPR) repeat protein